MLRLKTNSQRFVSVSMVLAGLGLAMPTMAAEGNYADLIAAATANFQPVSEAEIAAAHQDLVTAAKSMERTLGSGSPKSEKWRTYLQWEGIQKSLTSVADADLSALRETLDRLRFGATGVELPPFQRMASAIEKYVDLASVASAPDQQEFIKKQMELLTKYVGRYQTKPETRARFEIERRLDLLLGAGRAEELTSAIRQDFGHANIRTQLSERFLDRVAGKPVDDVAPVRDVILGTTIRGTGRTIGNVTLETIPSADRAVVMLHLNGVNYSQTHGYNDPVVIRSSGTTPFSASKRIELEDTNFWNYPTQVSATTTTKTLSVQKQGGGMGSKFIAKIGEKKVAEKKPQANRIAGQHAEVRIANNLEDELLPKLQDARYEYQEQFKNSLARRNAAPRYVAFSSTDSSVNVDILQAGRGELAADTEAPAFAAGHDLLVSLHETGAANLGTAILGGATLSQQTKEGKPKLNVELPKALRKAIDEARKETKTEPAEDDTREFKPWSMLFRRLRPVTVEFADNQVKVRLHTTRIKVKDETYDGWDIIVNYDMQLKDGGLLLTRNGDIEVIPTAFDPADGGGLTNRQVGLRGNLAKELNRQSEAGRGFPKEINVTPLDLPNKIAQHGPLLMQEASSEGGWLSLGWDLPR